MLSRPLAPADKQHQADFLHMQNSLSDRSVCLIQQHLLFPTEIAPEMIKAVFLPRCL